MPVDITLEPETNIMVLRYIGAFTNEGLTGVLKQYISHPDLTENLHQLHDMTEASLDLTPKGMQSVGLSIQYQRKVLGNDYRVAIVTDQPLNFGQMRQYMAYYPQDSPIEYRLFRSMAKARTWLSS